jgi:hypothetical protein
MEVIARKFSFEILQEIDSANSIWSSVALISRLLVYSFLPSCYSFYCWITFYFVLNCFISFLFQLRGDVVPKTAGNFEIFVHVCGIYWNQRFDTISKKRQWTMIVRR